MEKEILIFENIGFPKIKIYEDEFQIMDIDYWEFRTFLFSEVQSIEHYNPNDNWFSRFIISTSMAGRVFAKEDSWNLKIVKNNGGDWTYKTSPIFNPGFKKAINLIKKNIKATPQKSSITDTTTAEYSSSVWLGALVFFIINLGKTSFKELWVKKYSRRNLIVGYLFKLLLLFVFIYLIWILAF